MLVLARRKGESIRIAENVAVTILEIQGDQVRLGFEAPRSVRILRSEIVDQQREKDHAEGGEAKPDDGDPCEDVLRNLSV